MLQQITPPAAGGRGGTARWVVGLLLGLAAALGLAAPTSAAAAMRFVTIGTGGVTGVYYPVGKAIAKLLNQKSDEYHLKATVESTSASVFNINAVMAGDLDLGIAQSDAQYLAYHGKGEWQGKGPQKDLRSVFALHAETFILAANGEENILTYPDLKGKAVAVGSPGSGTRQNFLDMLAAYGMSFDDLGRVEGFKASESAKMLQDERIDAFVYTVGNPNGLVQEATSGRIPVRFIAADADKLALVIKENPFYVEDYIPIEYYPKALNKKDVLTLAVKATLITRAQVPDDVIYDITKEVFQNLGQLQKLHPALSRLDPQNMLKGLTAPIHPGALKYYREAGLIK
ncbi:MAG: TAXI family TRAP transporter solute-binding subunit [Deltaproteobacteria bacterium]|nr:TAXI family TRAP transporter solute-binding subunit [Deltaproteobacteria bacterium]